MLEIEQRRDKIGNVAWFVNHSCHGGNLSTHLFPCLCYFALKLKTSKSLVLAMAKSEKVWNFDFNEMGLDALFRG
jgi:hypothetical protein